MTVLVAAWTRASPMAAVARWSIGMGLGTVDALHGASVGKRTGGMLVGVLFEGVVGPMPGLVGGGAPVARAVLGVAVGRAVLPWGGRLSWAPGWAHPIRRWGPR